MRANLSSIFFFFFFWRKPKQALDLEFHSYLHTSWQSSLLNTRNSMEALSNSAVCQKWKVAWKHLWTWKKIASGLPLPQKSGAYSESGLLHNIFHTAPYSFRHLLGWLLLRCDDRNPTWHGRACICQWFTQVQVPLQLKGEQFKSVFISNLPKQAAGV